MSRFINRKSIVGMLIAFALVTSFVSGGIVLRGTSSHASGAPYRSVDAYIQYVQQHHKAPFDRDVVVRAAAQNAASQAAKIRQGYTRTNSSQWTNVMVNQDRNPWPKAELGAAVDPVSGKNYVVMANDFRENYDHQFYHVSTDGGKTWTDDSMTVGVDFNGTGGAPYNFQSDPGVAFDRVGHSFISNITGNLIFDFMNGYINLDTEIDLATGYANGTYTNLIATPIDYQPCNGTFTGPFNCAASLDKPFVTVDNVRGSPNKGSVYVYYTIFCSVGPGPNGACTDGNATIPQFSSAILESHSAGADLPFSAPALVSGSFLNTQFSNMVIDSHGTPHIFFDDFSNPQINMYESTLSGGTWTVSATPVATFSYNGLNNLNWFFRSFGTVAPGCGIYQDTAYCAFSASQISSGPTESTPSVYLAAVNTISGTTLHIKRVNNDNFNGSKDHFFPWASTSPSGAVYVGWYDDRRDHFNTKVDYFVGKSTDGGQTFPVQKPVNDVSFNPCIGFPFCGFFGDYTQLVTGPDGVTHAAWSDTRDGASMQIWSQSIKW